MRKKGLGKWPTGLILTFAISSVVLPVFGFCLGVWYLNNIKQPTKSEQRSCGFLGPEYQLARIGDWGRGRGGEKAEVIVDLNNDGKNEIVRVYDEKADSRTLPVVLKVFSDDRSCLKEEFSYGGMAVGKNGNEIGSLEAFDDFWGDGRKAVMFSFISTGYGSGFTSYLSFLTFEDKRYQVIGGPTLDELSGYKFPDEKNKGRQVLIARAVWKAGEEGHFDPHRYELERWDWNGREYTTTKLGTTKDKYPLSSTGVSIIEEIIKAEPEVLVQ